MILLSRLCVAVFYTHNLIFAGAIIGCSEIKMRNILKNRTALSTVVTTLIILVVSVLLAGVVTYFAINVTSTRVQEENLNMMYQHVWYSTGDTTAQAALVITNTGGRDVVLNKIAVRGQTCAWANVYVNNTANDPVIDLQYEATLPPTDYELAPTVGLTLKSGATMAIYISAPDSITVNDVGLTVAISIFSSQAIYYRETNVEAVV
jgi:hypothetical protein